LGVFAFIGDFKLIFKRHIVDEGFVISAEKGIFHYDVLNGSVVGGFVVSGVSPIEGFPWVCVLIDVRAICQACDKKHVGAYISVGGYQFGCRFKIDAFLVGIVPFDIILNIVWIVVYGDFAQ